MAVGLALYANSAVAQFVPLTMDRQWPGLSGDDLDRMHAAEMRLYEGRSIGSVERWRNPDTGNAGEVSLSRENQLNGVPCRQLNYTIRFAKHSTAQDRYALSWCRQPSGEWKIVDKRSGK